MDLLRDKRSVISNWKAKRHSSVKRMERNVENKWRLMAGAVSKEKA